jgi:hypothetical protein
MMTSFRICIHPGVLLFQLNQQNKYRQEFSGNIKYTQNPRLYISWEQRVWDLWRERKETSLRCVLDIVPQNVYWIKLAQNRNQQLGCAHGSVVLLISRSRNVQWWKLRTGLSDCILCSLSTFPGLPYKMKHLKQNIQRKLCQIFFYVLDLFLFTS